MKIFYTGCVPSWKWRFSINELVYDTKKRIFKLHLNESEALYLYVYPSSCPHNALEYRILLLSKHFLNSIFSVTSLQVTKKDTPTKMFFSGLKVLNLLKSGYPRA